MHQQGWPIRPRDEGDGIRLPCDTCREHSATGICAQLQRGVALAVSEDQIGADRQDFTVCLSLLIPPMDQHCAGLTIGLQDGYRATIILRTHQRPRSAIFGEYGHPATVLLHENFSA